MEAIQQGNVYNKLVCVTRWYGGKNLGPARFDTISELAFSALKLKPSSENDDDWDVGTF